jgi:thymidine kinase
MTDTLSRPGRGAGWIEVIVGSMFSGKTEELIRRLRRAQIAKQRIQVFKPKIDNRYSNDSIASHSEQRTKSVPVGTAKEILSLVNDATRVVGIDEGQFFDPSLVEVCQKLADRGIRVIVSGLDTDWQGRPFEPMPQLMAVAEIVLKSNAICVVCGGLASRTQRLSDSTARVQVGAAGMYEARCRGCFTVELPASEKVIVKAKRKRRNPLKEVNP